MTISTDRRSIDAEPDPEGESLLAAAAAEYLDVRLRVARALLRLERKGTYHLSSCSSIVQYGVRLGIPAGEVRMLVDLGRALEAPPSVALPTPTAATPATVEAPADAAAAPAPAQASVEDRVRSGEIPVANAALVGRVLAKPGAAHPGEDWFRKAAILPTPELRKQVNARLEELAQGAENLVPVTVHVTEEARANFARARVIASREAAQVLTEGHTFALALNHYLDDKDERRRGAGARRVGPTSDLPGERRFDDRERAAMKHGRSVPASVRREVLDRSGDRCEVAGCPNTTFLEMAHIRGHAEGGSREASNLVLACSAHHTQLDAGWLRFAGWSDGPERARPLFRDARGVLLTHGCGVRLPRAGPPAGEARGGPAGRCERTTQVSERPPPWPATAE